MTTIAVLADTHGLLRPEAVAALTGVEHILHAGDVGDQSVLTRLREIAPVTAVRGNVDTEPPLSALPLTDAVDLAGRLFYLVHRLEDLDLDPIVAGIDVVVTGHSHRLHVETRQGVLYLNAGSIGPRRLRLPITMILLRISAAELTPEIITLG